jgi:uncharacterized protein YbaR (Trm112 family)/SAM-dependent methyltransferase
MRIILVDLLCCPECHQFPLDLTIVEEGHCTRRVGGRLCEQQCGRLRVPTGTDGECERCLLDDVETGYLFCSACERFYFILEGIPRLLGEQFRDLVDWSLPARAPLAFRDKEAALERFRRRMTDVSDPSEEVQWNLEDVSFWQEKVYGSPEETAALFERVRRSRPDAGNRSYPRERTIFSHIRPRLAGGVLLDVGCGVAQTIRVLCPPEHIDYVYIGLELSISALTTNRQTMSGDFVQCSADQLPFRDNSVDAVVTLGTLHHLASPERTVGRALDSLRAGGLLGIDEVISRRHLARRVNFLERPGTAESAHNESIDIGLVEQVLQPTADVLEMRYRWSPIRGLLVARLGEAMRSRPWLTRLVLGLDDACLATLGRVWPFFGPREVLLVARKRTRVRRTPAPIRPREEEGAW